MAKIKGSTTTGTGVNPSGLKIVAWSFSRLATYTECPRKAFYKFIKRLPEPGSPAMDRGDRIHKALEKYLKDPKEKTLPAEVDKKLKKYYETVRKQEAKVELEIAFDSEWRRVEWFAKNAWARIKIDALVFPLANAKVPNVRIIDHKTGKLKEHGEYDDQLELYGLSGLLIAPTAAQATGELAFTDHGEVLEGDDPYPRKDEEKLKKKWAMKVKPMLSDTRFDPLPGRACNWCAFSKGKGGPCEF